MNEYIELRINETISGYTLNKIEYNEYDENFTLQINESKEFLSKTNIAYREDENDKQLNFKTFKLIEKEWVVIVFLSEWM